MSAMTDHFEDDAPEQAPRVNWQDAREEDAYWSGAFWQERYYRWDCDYEDYAPAYCVGYAGCAQYGGAFAQAERSLCANWERIKGDSRLSLEEALPAIEAAWNRTAVAHAPAPAQKTEGVARKLQRLRTHARPRMNAPVAA